MRYLIALGLFSSALASMPALGKRKQSLMQTTASSNLPHLLYAPLEGDGFGALSADCFQIDGPRSEIQCDFEQVMISRSRPQERVDLGKLSEKEREDVAKNFKKNMCDKSSSFKAQGVDETQAEVMTKWDGFCKAGDYTTAALQKLLNDLENAQDSISVKTCVIMTHVFKHRFKKLDAKKWISVGDKPTGRCNKVESVLLEADADFQWRYSDRILTSDSTGLCKDFDSKPTIYSSWNFRGLKSFKVGCEFIKYGW
jgi:hypothetical protein